MRASIASPLVLPSPLFRRVGIRIITFEACSSFTHITARWIAQPPKAAFVTRLQPNRLPGKAARQLPDLSTIIWVEPPSTGVTRRRGALKNKGLKLYVSMSVLAAAIAAAPQFAIAQSTDVSQIPLDDFCPNTFGSACSGEVFGTRTVTQNRPASITPIPGGALFDIDANVKFDGKLQVSGLNLDPNPFLPSALLFDIKDSFDVRAKSDYDAHVIGKLQFGQFVYDPATSFSFNELEASKISVDLRDIETTLADGSTATVTLKTENPTVITENSTALTGKVVSMDGQVLFGKISGTATLVGNPGVTTIGDLDFVSPYALRSTLETQVTTLLNEDGLITPTIAVTDGINMNGSRITNLGEAVNGGDAVNLAQVTKLIATSGPVQNSEGDGALAGGSGSSASGNGAVALGQGQQATGNGAVAIGDPNVATGQGAVAIGADNTATGKGAVALGNRNVATGPGAVAIGSDSTASRIGNVALGFNAEATGAGASALGSNTIASATNSTAVGYGAEASGANALAVGYQSSATGGSSTAIGTNASASAVNSSAFGLGASATAQNSVALGQGSVANQVNTVSVGAAGAERRVVNVAAAVNATDAVNKGQFDAESTQRKAAEALLQTNLTAEANARLAGDAALQTAINTEASTRSTADAALQHAINLEANTRSAAVTSLQNGLDGEAAARLAADTAEANKRAAEDTRLYETISEEGARRLAADNAEANARAAADNRLQGQINTLGTSLFSLTGRVTTLENTVKQDRRDARQGIAAAVAMTPAPMPSAPGKVAYSVNVANFRDEQAVAASLAMRLRGPNPMAVTAGISYGGGANTAVRVGVAGEF